MHALVVIIYYQCNFKTTRRLLSPIAIIALSISIKRLRTETTFPFLLALALPCAVVLACMFNVAWLPVAYVLLFSPLADLALTHVGVADRVNGEMNVDLRSNIGDRRPLFGSTALLRAYAVCATIALATTLATLVATSTVDSVKQFVRDNNIANVDDAAISKAVQDSMPSWFRRRDFEYSVVEAVALVVGCGVSLGAVG